MMDEEMDAASRSSLECREKVGESGECVGLGCLLLVLLVSMTITPEGLCSLWGAS